MDVTNAPHIPLTPALAEGLIFAGKTYLRPQRDSIRSELRKRPQWLVWALEPRADKPDEATKVPYTATGKRGSSTDPQTWMSLDAAWDLYSGGNGAWYSGIGFVVTESDPYTGIDLDGCRDPQTGVITPEALQVVMQIDSYTEISPSRTGLRIWMRGTLPANAGHVAHPPGMTKLEVYDRARFFTVTGVPIEGPSPNIEERQNKLDALCARWFSRPAPSTKTIPSERSKSDRAILGRIFEGERGKALRKTWEQDESKGDYALAAAVREAIGTDDVDWIEQVIRTSPFVRTKYDEMRGSETYLRYTINNLLARGEDLRPLHELLADVERFLRRFVVFASAAQTTALTLWVLHTHALEAADITSYIAVTAPDKQSGKTRCFEVLELLVAQPWRVVCPSEAVVYRKIELGAPTLLLDETDAVFKDKGHMYEGLRALLNSGYRRGAMVPRCVGEGTTITIKDFPTFCPKAFAGIGDLPDTIADRSIPVHLVRRTKDEKIERFRDQSARHEAAPLVAALARWGESAVDALRETRPEPILEISDRADETWEPLLAIAELAGGDWPDRARRAALELHAVSATQQNWGTELLAAVRETFVKSGKDRMSTEDLVNGVLAVLPVEKWIRAKNAGDTRVAGRKLAQALKKWRVSPRTIRTKDGTPRGYLLSDLQPVFDRWLPPIDNAEALDSLAGDCADEPAWEDDAS